MTSFNGRWLADKEAFRLACVRASKDLSTFKQDPHYFSHVGNDIRGYETALGFYKYILEHYPYLWKYMPKFLQNDSLGNPITHHVGAFKISVGTLRFMKVLGDIYGAFGVLYSAVEIGAGYGGQCKVIKDALTVDYTIIDIPESLMVSRAYLNELKVRCEFMQSDKVKPKEYDLVISDYCLSELDEDGIDFYIDNVVSKCKHGYFTINSYDSNTYLKGRLIDTFESCEFKEEDPPTSRHKNIIAICSNG